MIRNITAGDFDFIYGLYMHPEINPFLLYEMMDANSFKPVFDDLLARDIIYVVEAEKKRVGMFKLIQQQHRNSHIAYVGGVAVHPDFAGKGYGRIMMNELLELGRRLNILRIELSTATFNDKAIRLYENVGFAKEGVMRKYTHLKSEGRFVDEYLMSYLY